MDKRTPRGFRVYATIRDADRQTVSVVQSSTSGMRNVRIYTTPARGPHLAPRQIRRLIKALEQHLSEVGA